jgi:glycerate kinase
MLFCGAELKSGIEAMLDMVQFEKYLDKANLVITGEGSIDGSSTYGKVPVGVAQRAKKFDLPVLAVVGGIGAEAAKVYDFGIHAIMNILPSAMSLEEAMAGSSAFIEDSAERAMRIISIGQRLV